MKHCNITCTTDAGRTDTIPFGPFVKTLRCRAVHPWGSRRFLPRPPADAPPLCLLAHVYYPETLERAGRLHRKPPEGHVRHLRESGGCGPSTMRSFPVSGIGFHPPGFTSAKTGGGTLRGHVRLLENVRLEGYRMFGLVHTKMSPHMAGEEAALWRGRLLDPLMGTKRRARENVNLMLKDRTIGQIAAADCRHTEIDGNREEIRAAAGQAGRWGRRQGRSNALTGTMMFLRAEVLRRLFDGVRDLPFENSDGRSPDFYRDGQWEHAVERVIGSVCARHESPVRMEVDRAYLHGLSRSVTDRSAQGRGSTLRCSSRRATRSIWS